VSGKILTVLCFIFVVSSYLAADSPGKTKIIVGSVLLGGGAILTVDGANNFCFGDYPGRDAELIAGVAMVGAGTVCLIWGLLDRAKGKKSNARVENQEGHRFLVGVAPLKNGVAGSVIFRW
jgi:hypothetical protein